MTWLKASLRYFVMALGTRFVLGMVRVPFLVPRLGERYADRPCGGHQAAAARCQLCMFV